MSLTWKDPLRQSAGIGAGKRKTGRDFRRTDATALPYRAYREPKECKAGHLVSRAHRIDDSGTSRPSGYGVRRRTGPDVLVATYVGPQVKNV